MKRYLKKSLSIILVLFILLSTVTGDAASSVKTKNLTSSIKSENVRGIKIKKKDAYAMTSASLKMLDMTIQKDKENTNVLISPLSIMSAFGLAENGARGKTRTQIEDVVFGGIKTDRTNKLMFGLINRMEKDKNVKWVYANSVWISDRKDVNVKKKFLKSVKSYYDAEIYKAPFNSSTANDINKWVKKNTNDMIPKIVDKMDENEVMYLINAMSFEASWTEPFKDVQIDKSGHFTDINGAVKKTTMMSEEQSGYFELNGSYGFKKFYKGGKYAFVGIEMPENVKPADYISKLSKTPKKFNKALSNIQYDRKVFISMPKYEIDYDADLSSSIKALGATRAFNKNKANLYNMFKRDGDTNYYFSKVLHKTHIEVDKRGTKAAAATAIVVNKTTAVKPNKETLQIKLDHPFVYAIVDNETNVPIFIGVVNSL